MESVELFVTKERTLRWRNSIEIHRISRSSKAQLLYPI